MHDVKCADADIVIVVGKQEIEAHKSVLARHSDYFNAMFLSPFYESSAGNILLHKLEYMAVKLIIDYMYSRELKITASNVQGLLQTADFLQVPNVKEKCEAHMLRCVNSVNCLQVYEFSKQYQLTHTEAKCLSTALKCFEELAEDKEYLDCRPELLLSLLSSSDLNISDEFCVFEVVITWLQHDPSTRLQHLIPLLDCVRFSLLKKSEVGHALRHSLIKSSGYKPEGGETAERVGMLNNRIYILNGFCDRSNTKRAHTNKGEVIELVATETLQSKILSTHSADQSTSTRAHSADQSRSARSPVAVQGAGCTVIDNVVYVVGGATMTRNQSSNNVWSFKPHTQEWSKLAPLPTARHHLCVTAVDGKVYACGGLQGREGATDIVEVYDPVSECWSQAPSMHNARGHACCIGVSSSSGLASRIFVIGGYSQNKMSSVEVLSSGTEWSDLPSMLKPRHEFGAGMVGGMILVVGGWSEPSVERYDFRVKQWSFLNPFTKPRNCMQAVVCDDVMYVLGGSKNSHNVATVEVYKPEKDTWSTVLNLKMPRIYASLAVL